MPKGLRKPEGIESQDWTRYLKYKRKERSIKKAQDELRLIKPENFDEIEALLLYDSMSLNQKVALRRKLGKQE